MLYHSTRNDKSAVDSAQAVLSGLAPDGGLYVPESLPQIDVAACLQEDTMQMAERIIGALLPDIPNMGQLVKQAYVGKFQTEELTPTVDTGKFTVLELFRGPTSAFKDVALCMLPQLLTAAKKSEGQDKEILILTATSGDTGKAALEGFHDVDGIRIYNNMLRFQGNNPENHRILAMLYSEKEQPFSAIIVLDSAEMRFGIHEAISPLKRQLLVATAQYDRALKQSEELIAADPYNIENYIIAAELYAHAQKDSLAMVNASSALYTYHQQLDSTSVDVLDSLNDYYGRRNDHPNYLRTLVPLYASKRVPLQGKIENFKRLTSNIEYYKQYYGQLNQLAMTVAVTHPDDYEAMELYTGHLITTGDMDRALEIYKSHVNDSVPRVEIFNTILDIESFKKRADSVEYYTRRAMERFPDRAEFILRRGTYYLVNHQYRKAEEAFVEALKRIDSDSLRGATLSMIGDAQYSDNRHKAAFRSYEKALKLLPDDAGLLNNYSYFLSEKGRDLERALEMSSRAIEISRNNSTYLDTYAWILYKLGRYDEAKKAMRQAIALDQTQSEVLMCHYGDILHALGENFMARIYWEKARDGGYDKAEIEARLEKLKK